MKPYTFYSTPSHGYLQVHNSAIVRLGVAPQISHFSYFNPATRAVYLEEDCDAQAFISAAAASENMTTRDWVNANVTWVNRDDDQFIKELPRVETK